jgi:hypothetical protein
VQGREVYDGGCEFWAFFGRSCCPIFGRKWLRLPGKEYWMPESRMLAQIGGSSWNGSREGCYRLCMLIPGYDCTKNTRYTSIGLGVAI